MTTDPDSEYSKLKYAISNYTFVLKSKDKLYNMCPGSDVLRTAYGESFWVINVPCSGVILYTQEGSKS